MPNNCELSSTKNWQEMFSFALEYLYEVELFVKCCFYIWKYCWIFCQMWFSFVEIPESFIKMLSVTNVVDFMVFKKKNFFGHMTIRVMSSFCHHLESIFLNRLVSSEMTEPISTKVVKTLVSCGGYTEALIPQTQNNLLWRAIK